MIRFVMVLFFVGLIVLPVSADNHSQALGVRMGNEERVIQLAMARVKKEPAGKVQVQEVSEMMSPVPQPDLSAEEEDRKKLIAEVLESSGFKLWLSRLPARSEQEISELPEAVKGDPEGFKKYKDEVYGADRINQLFQQNLQQYYAQAGFNAYRDFLLTPLGKKMTEREAAVEKMSAAELKTAQEAFAQVKMTQERIQLLSVVLESSRRKRLEAAVIGYTRVLMFRTKFYMTEEQLFTEISGLMDEQGWRVLGMSEEMFLQEAFFCRDFSDQELKDYIQAVANPDIDYVIEAMYQAVVDTFAKMRQDYISGFDQRFPPIVSEISSEKKPEPQDFLAPRLAGARELKLQLDKARKQGDTKLAQETAGKMISLMEQLVFWSPDSLGLCMTLGLSYWEERTRPGRAAVLLEKVIAQETKTAQPFHFLGTHYLELGKFDRAEVLLKKSLAISTEAKDFVGQGLTQYTLGLLYERKGELDLAWEFLEKAVQILPENPQPYGLMSLIAARQGKIDLAEKYLKQAEQLGLNSVNGVEIRSMIGKNRKE